MIADYTYYTDTYGGDMFDSETEYNRAERRAELELNKYIDISGPTYPDNVKMCCCSLAELFNGLTETETRMLSGIYSEKVSGYSITYGGMTADRLAMFRQKINDIIELYLGDIIKNAGYRGVSRHVL